MRSKTLEFIIKIILALVFYAIAFPALVFVRDILGIDSENAYKAVELIAFVIVYGLVSIGVGIVMSRLNDRLREVRKNSGGRDIAAEEEHEDEATGMISLSLKDK